MSHVRLTVFDLSIHLSWADGTPIAICLLVLMAGPGPLVPDRKVVTSHNWETPLNFRQILRSLSLVPGFQLQENAGRAS